MDCVRALFFFRLPAVLIFIGAASAADNTPPIVTQLIPAASSTNRTLYTMEVIFDEGVSGVDASDLLINGQPADEVEFFGDAHYLFHFAPPATGVVQFAWAPSHRIIDAVSNDFGGGNWSVTFDPRFGVPDIVISEFMAANLSTTNDVDGDSSDWIELFNAGQVPVALGNWFLTDTTNDLTKWRFPDYVFPAGAYLLVWASEKDRTNPTAQLHTNFKLNQGGEYLALVGPETNIVSEFAPGYPPQKDNVSFGRDPVDPSIVGFYPTPTPGKRNSTSGAGTFASDVVFSTNSGTFVNPFMLTLSLKTPTSNAVIRYTLGTNAPTTNSTRYTTPLMMSNTVQVRARVFVPGMFPGDVHSEQYIALHSNVLAFTSDLPLIILHNNGGGAVPASVDQFVMAQTFEPVDGRSSLTNAPNDRARGIFHRRGSSTLDFAKSSFFLETQDEFKDDKDETLLGLPADSDWVLYAPNRFDPPLIHNPIGCELARQAGRYASRTRFVVVFLKDDGTAGRSVTTNDYNGIYVLEEKIKIGKHRVDIAKLDAGDNAAPDVTGGYLLSIDSASRVSPGETQFVAGAQAMNYVDPHYAEIVLPQRDAQEQYLKSYFNQFGTALNGSSYTNPITGYDAYIDAGSWIDFHINGVMTRNVDATEHSTYLYKPRTGKICFGPVWDFDRSQGGTDGRDFSPRVWNCGTSADYFGYSWWGRLFSDANFWQRWIDRYQELRRSTFANSNVFLIIDRFANDVRQEQPREEAKWGVHPRSGATNRCGFAYNFGAGSFEGEINWLKIWFSNRLDFIDGELEAPPAFNRDAGRVTNGTAIVLSGPPGATILYTLDGSDPRAIHGTVANNAQIYSGPVFITNNVRIVARCRDLNHHNLTGGLNPPVSSPWSGPSAGTFYTQLPPLLITEIMFHPPNPLPPDATDPDDFEFIELKNAGADTLSLVGFRFTNGIDFTFTATNATTNLAPGAYTVLVRNRAAFSARYPGMTNIAGEFTGNLDNGGERIYLEGPVGEPVADFAYDDLWYSQTDGGGFSLVLVDELNPPQDLSDSGAWRPSSDQNGSPGRADMLPALLAARSGERIVLAWPASMTGFTLESATNFSSPAWLPVTNGVVNANGVFEVWVPVEGAASFFRLRFP